LEDNVSTIKKNAEAHIDASKEICPEEKTKKIKYMLTSRHQNSGQNHDVKTANRSLENVAQLKYLGTKATVKIMIHEEIKSRLNSDNACNQ
jgi:hypothetical protein